MIGLMACVAVGFLLLLFRSPAPIAPRKRVTDIAAEQAAGTIGGNIVAAASSAKVEQVDIEGEFMEFDGQPGETAGAWPHFRGTDFSNISNDSVALAESWEEGGPPLLWDKPIDLGEGHSGAVVWKGRLYVMDYDEEKQGMHSVASR